MKHPSFKRFILTRPCLTAFGSEFSVRKIPSELSQVRLETVPGGQFKWGACLLKSNGGVYQGWLAPNGNRSDRAKP